MDRDEYFYSCDTIGSQFLPSFTTWCEWKFPCAVNVPPLITGFFAFVNMTATLRSSDCRCGPIGRSMGSSHSLRDYRR